MLRVVFPLFNAFIELEKWLIDSIDSSEAVTSISWLFRIFGYTDIIGFIESPSTRVVSHSKFIPSISILLSISLISFSFF